MKMYNKWAQQIIDIQHENGSWGYFHTLSQPTNKQPLTTEQALRRLYILGLTAEDEPIQRALEYLHGILACEYQLPDRREKVLNWDAFETHMVATWIRLFAPHDPAALSIAQLWAKIITASFQGEHKGFNAKAYEEIYRQHIPKLHREERLIAITQFYMVNLLHGLLESEIESRFVDHLLHNPTGIYYVYGSRLLDLPSAFSSKETNHWLAAIEMLSGYACAHVKLQFAVEWLNANRDKNGEWDLGPNAKDGIYFPLSDSWRKTEYRKADCTKRITHVLCKLNYKQ